MGKQHMFDPDEPGEDDLDYLGATKEEVIESLNDEIQDLVNQVSWLRTSVGDMRRWIALYRAGELTEKLAIDQLERDIERFAGRLGFSASVPQGGKTEG